MEQDCSKPDNVRHLQLSDIPEPRVPESGPTGHREREDAEPNQADSRHMVVFDFDGTLTRAGTLVPFLLAAAPKRLLLHLPQALVRVYTGDLRDKVMEHLIARALRHLGDHAVAELGERFVERHLPKLWRPGMVDVLRSHVAAGDRVVIASASPAFVIGPAAAALGVHEYVCSQFGTRDGAWVPLSENVRLHAKLRHVQQLHRGEKVTAYGNSKDDLPLLRWAGQGWFVTRNGRIRPV